MFEDRSQYLKIDEAARLLGVSQRTVYRWIWKGELPASKIGGLYFIPRLELQRRLDQAQPSSGDVGPVATPLTLKCGYCFQILTDEAQISEICRHEGCEQVICRRCAEDGIHTCAAHIPDRAERLAQAQAQLKAGEVALIVSGETARLREISFINRIQARLAGITTLLHPVSGEPIESADWDSLLESGDDRLEVMQMLGRVLLDADTLTRTPLNPWLAYRIPPGKKQKGVVIEIQIQVLSHLKRMLRDGYDTQPLGAADLAPWLVKTTEELQGRQSFRLVLLASTCGWDDEARRMISADGPGKGFAHRTALFYLYDLEKGELIFNRHDERARPYAELFAPRLPSEELVEAIKAVENELVVYQSLTLELAAKTLPYSQDQLRRAFERLAAGGGYALTEVPDLGLAIVRV